MVPSTKKSTPNYLSLQTPIKNLLKLEAIKVSDAREIRECRLDSETRRLIGPEPDSLSPDEKHYEFLIHYGPQMVGGCNLYLAVNVKTVAQVGFWIGAGHRGMGLGSQALRNLLQIAFITLQADAVVARCWELNDRAIRFLIRFGFRFAYSKSTGEPIPNATQRFYFLTAKDWSKENF
jgi:RimJ/RimL family protein N-acetyltransferase